MLPFLLSPFPGQGTVRVTWMPGAAGPMTRVTCPLIPPVGWPQINPVQAYSMVANQLGTGPDAGSHQPVL